jgi:hypothetical protein
MTRPEPIYDGTEGDILDELYEWPEVTFSSHTLTQRLNRNLRITAPEYRTAFDHVGRAIEEHISRELIRGKRSRDADGVLFDNLKLTPKGERAAIQVRKQRASGVNVELIMDVAEALRMRDRGA